MVALIGHLGKMNIILNIIAFALCMTWFHKKMNSKNNALITPVILTFLIASIIAVVISLVAKAEYLDGIHYLITGSISLLMFWIWTTFIIVKKSLNNRKQLFSSLAQNILLLTIPLIIWVLISNTSLKIGG